MKNLLRASLFGLLMVAMLGLTETASAQGKRDKGERGGGPPEWAPAHGYRNKDKKDKKDKDRDWERDDDRDDDDDRDKEDRREKERKEALKRREEALERREKELKQKERELKREEETKDRGGIFGKRRSEEEAPSRPEPRRKGSIGDIIKKRTGDAEPSTDIQKKETSPATWSGGSGW